MKNMFISFCCSMLLFTTTFAQQDTNKDKAVDEYVTKLGSLDSQNVANIAKAITGRLSDKDQKCRAIFYWIANNISLDLKAVKLNDERKSLPEDVVKYRKATPLGYAKLFQEMSSMVNIRCLVVDGFTKNFIEDVDNPADEINFSWNVVQLGTSPDQWFFVDVAKAAGYADKKMSVFTKDFTSEYFFADRTLFNLDHFPDNDAWQLGGGPRSKKEFYALPVIYNTAYKFGLKKPTPAMGIIKAKTIQKVSFGFPYSSSLTVSNVSLVIGDGRKLQKPEPMNFETKAGAISFSYQFKTEDSFPVLIILNGKPLLHYMVQVTE